MKTNKKHFEIYTIPKPAEVFTTPSPKMIKTLKKCYQMELEYPGKPYGPADFKESFLGLYKRGFLDFHPNEKNKSKPGSWYITTKGLQFLITIANKPGIIKDVLLLNNINNLRQNLSILRKSIHNLKVTSGRIPE